MLGQGLCRETQFRCQFRCQFRRSHAAISTADYLIAATALVRDLGLATLNVRHFPMFAELEAPFTLWT